ncbi:hypothetical protein [Klebsiella pneumoniae]
MKKAREIAIILLAAAMGFSGCDRVKGNMTGIAAIVLLIAIFILITLTT